MGAVQLRQVDLGSALWLDVGGHGGLGLGALSLWPLGLRERRVGVGARTARDASRVRPRPGGVLRGARSAGERRHAGAELGRPRLGRAAGALVGPGRLRRTAVVGWLGWAAR